MSDIAVPEPIAFDAAGLVPVVVQERASGDVLMLAYANAESLAETARTGLAHFWSRSRGKLWKKGESSGNVMRVCELRADCDKDALLMVVLGGPGTLVGAAIGAGVVVALREYLSTLVDWWQYVLGTVYVLTILYLPSGLMGLPQRLRRERHAGREANESGRSARGNLEESRS